VTAATATTALAAAPSAAEAGAAATEPLTGVQGGQGRRVPGALLMSIGTVASGVLAYAFNAVAARALGPEAYGPIAVLWAAMCLVAVVLFRPLEQTLSRAVAERLAAGHDARPVARTVAAFTAGAVAIAAGACAIAWGTLTDRLFDGQPLLTAMLIAGIAGYGASYFMRGLVGGQRWYAAYGQLLLIDGGVRLALVLPLLVWASTSLAATATAVAAIAGAFGPLLAPGRRERASLEGTPGAHFDAASAARFAGPVAILAAGDQVLLNGGPVLVMLGGGAHAGAAAGVVFAATMLVRAPAFLFQGVSAALLPNLTTMLVRGDGHGFRRAVTRLTLMLLGFAAVLTVLAAAAGPWGMHLFYGDGFAATHTELALLGAGAGGYLVAATLSQAALARGEAVGAAAIWAGSAALFVALELAIPGEPLFRVALAFCLATLANATTFWALSLTRRTPAQATTPLRLAAHAADH
jgi:O-antigen/teichoic acid export membrane protein